MHWSLEQVLWALLLAAHLILLIVLLGRDRMGRFPWFTAFIALAAARLLIDHLLHGKLTQIAFYWQSYSLAIIGSIVEALVLLELARRVFSSGQAGKVLKPAGWLGGIMVSIAVGAAVLWLWGPWPTWQALNAEPALLPLRLVWLSALKLDLLVSVLAVGFMLLVNLFGGGFGFPWKSHPRQIALGLSTLALSQYAVEAISQVMIRQSSHLTSREQIDHVVRLLTNLDHGRSVVWLLVLIWWMVCLWRDESGSTTLVALPAAPEPHSAEEEELAPEEAASAGRLAANLPEPDAPAPEDAAPPKSHPGDPTVNTSPGPGYSEHPNPEI
jgi:hypothetical protein